jgi:hypothetical protein
MHNQISLPIPKPSYSGAHCPYRQSGHLPSSTNPTKQILETLNIQHRYKAFAWRLIRQALASGDRGARFSNNIDKHCSTCGQVETDDHLFFNCSFAIAVWFAVDPPLRTDQLSQLTGYVQEQLEIILDTNNSM